MQHLQKAFFDKIKADNRKWLFVAKKTVKQVNSKKYVDMGIRSPIQRSKRLVEIFKYMQSRSIEMEKIREITKSVVFPSFLVEKNTYSRFFSQGHLQWSLLISAKKMFCKLKNSKKYLLLNNRMPLLIRRIT